MILMVLAGTARPPSTEFDEAFVLRLKRRDEPAFNQLVLSMEGSVFRLTERMLGTRAEAEEMTQEIFVQVWKHIESFRGDSKLTTWVYRIAVNLTKNRSKYLKRRYQRSHSDIDGSDPREIHLTAQGTTVGETTRPDQSAIGKQTEQIVKLAFEKLDPDHKEILLLRDIEGLSYEEVGSIIDLPPGTVKSRLHRARAELKTTLEELLGEKLP